MSWPKRHTRRIHIGDREFLWHLSGNQIETENRITVGTETGRYFLFIDPYAHDFEITPASVREAIEWALNDDWSPDAGPNRAMAYSIETSAFVWLPDNTRFDYETKTSGSDT